MTKAGVQRRSTYDLGFMYSRQCNLFCPFCMYDAGPDQVDELDLQKLHRWLKTVPYSCISSFGFYGGEVSIRMADYGRLIELLPVHVPKWVITNGSWSTDPVRTAEFLTWCANNRLHVLISGTPEHQKHQDRKLLEELVVDIKGITLKRPDMTWYPMGRLSHLPKTCTQKCLRDTRPTRIAVMPDGKMIFQTCDGVYPVLGTIDTPFLELVKKIQDIPKCCTSVSPQAMPLAA